MKIFKLTIYQYMIIFLSVIGVFGVLNKGIVNVLPHVMISVIACVVIDGVFEFAKTKRFVFSQSAVISGLIIGEVLEPGNLFLALFVSFAATVSKHFINFDKRHVFNPANLGLFLAMVFFTNTSSWWGGSLSGWQWYVMAAFGIFIAYKMKNFPLLAAFFVAHSVIAGLYAFSTGQPILGYVLSVNLYFMFFMLVEPMTSPKKQTGKIVYGILVAILGFLAIFILPKYDHYVTALVIVDLFAPVINRIFVK